MKTAAKIPQQGKQQYTHSISHPVIPSKPDSNAYDVLFDRKVDLATAGLRASLSKSLRYETSHENALVICNYIIYLKTEINLSDNYRMTTISLLAKLSKFHNQKLYKDITREIILTFFDNLRKPEGSDPLHKWIGTYNTYRIQLLRFFKWLYYPDIESNKRPIPSILENIPQLRRKEQSIYKPSDLWTTEEDQLFLRYCPSKRMKCYHAVARDIACRPHEILKLRLSSISFKSVGNRQYAEVVVNGKTGRRSLPLIDSLPYVKDYLEHEHPQAGNPTSVFLCGTGKSLGRSLRTDTIHRMYSKYKNEIFPKLLDNPNVPPEDKQKICELLKKPWNPYLSGRHTSLTQKSRILKESTLRVFAGWSNNSDMPKRYIHLFGNAACEDLLQAYGLIPKDQQAMNVLQSKQCPNCNEPNKPDSKFCAKCRMVLTYDSYNETLEEQANKNKEVESLKQEMASMQEAQKEILCLLKDPQKLLSILKSDQ